LIKELVEVALEAEVESHIANEILNGRNLSQTWLKLFPNLV